MFLGVLVDFVDRGKSIGHVVTWRGKNGFGVLDLMIEIWRKEEMKAKVHRTADGVIEGNPCFLKNFQKEKDGFLVIFEKD